MPVELTPLEAARIANGVYNVLKDEGLPSDEEKRLFRTGLSKLKDDEGGFDPTMSFEGASGYSNVHTPTIATQKLLVEKGARKPSKFGFFAQGEGSRADQAIVATRGTAIVPDILTDLWAKPSRSAMGPLAHSGFIDTYHSYEDDLAAFAREIQGRVNVVHCVGHSLGGALATLNADYLSQQGFKVYLYTYGSPRVGFGSGIRDSLATNDVTVRRVFHDGDPVPMVPCWPFVHTEGEFCIGRQLLITPGAHSMDDSYIPGAARFDSWLALERSPDPLAHKDMNFLQQALETGKSLSGYLLRAIMFALKKLLRAAEVILGVAVAGTLALLDFLAWMLAKAAVLSAEFGKKLMSVLGSIMRFLGKTIAAGVSLAERFIRWLLEQLFNAISSRAMLGLVALLAAPPVAALPASIPLTLLGGF